MKKTINKIGEILHKLISIPENLTKEYRKLFDATKGHDAFVQLQLWLVGIGFVLFVVVAILLARNTNFMPFYSLSTAFLIVVLFYFLAGFILINTMNLQLDKKGILTEVHYSLFQKIKYSIMFALAEIATLVIVILALVFLQIIRGDIG